MSRHYLTFTQAQDIRSLLKEGYRYQIIAERFGIPKQTIADIMSGRTYQRQVHRKRQPMPVEGRFIPKVQKCEHQDCQTCCWPWVGARTGRGKDQEKMYGVINVNGKPRKACVVSWELHHRQPFPDGMWGLHTCHYPPCVNPHHVYPGTALQNTKDMIDAGRARYRQGPAPWATGDNSWQRRHPEMIRRGADHPFAKLTAVQVEEIRAIHASHKPYDKQLNRRALAQKYGISLGGLDHILYGKTWNTSY